MNKSVLPISLETMRSSNQTKTIGIKNEPGNQRFADSFEKSQAEVNRAVRNSKTTSVERQDQDRLKARKLESIPAEKPCENQVKAPTKTHSSITATRAKESEQTQSEKNYPPGESEVSAQTAKASMSSENIDDSTTNSVDDFSESDMTDSDLVDAVTSSIDPAAEVTSSTIASPVELSVQISNDPEQIKSAAADLASDLEKKVGIDNQDSKTNGVLVGSGKGLELTTEGRDLAIDSATDEKGILEKSFADTQTSELTSNLKNDAIAAQQTDADPLNLGPHSQTNLAPNSQTQSSEIKDGAKASTDSVSLAEDFDLSAEATKSDGKKLPLEASKAEAQDDLAESSEFQLESTDDKTRKTEFTKLLANSVEDKPLVDKSAADKPQSSTPLSSLSNATTSSPANRLFVPQTQVNFAVPHPHWGNAVGEKILWMANQQLSSADIRLDPPELGSLQVRVNVQHDQANVTFISPHPQVRELLDQQVNRLREMFAEQGLQLGQVDITDRREQHSQDSQGNSRNPHQFHQSDAEDEMITSPISSLYLVDQFV